MEFFNNAVGNAPDLDREMIDQENFPRTFQRDSATYEVGTTYVNLCGAIGAQNVTGSRTKVSGGTVTSVTIQGYSGQDLAGAGTGDDLGWVDALVLTDDTVLTLALGDVGFDADRASYEKLRLKIVIAASAVVMNWVVRVK